MRALALQFAIEIQPQLSMDQLQEIADALNGTPESVNCSVSPEDIDWKELGREKPPKEKSAEVWEDLKGELINDNYRVFIFVDPIKGDDTNDGSISSPLKWINTAVAKSQSYSRETMKYIVLRGGRHYLKDTITLNYENSNMIFTNYNGELAEVSGAAPLECTWKLYKQNSNNMSIYECNSNGKAIDPEITDIYGLRVNGQRGIRARYPNANPETQGFGSTLQALGWKSPPGPYLPDFEYNPDYPLRNESVEDYFWYFNLGMGGPCDVFDPPAGYWCSSNPQGGGASTYRLPYAMEYNKTILPNSPYKNVSGAVIQAWRPGHWASWMFLVDYEKSNDNLFYFSKGGFQDGRGNNDGDEFFVENIFEELDAPSEWFYNQSSRLLYFYNNQTGVPDQEFEATFFTVLFSFSGNMTNPVSNMTIRGLTLRDTQYTYLDPHGMPSGGDWALQRTGAISMNGTWNISIIKNTMTRLDGNAISVNQYNRLTNIVENEIVWNGDTAIAIWGDANGVTFPMGQTITSMGWDGTNGDQPRGVHVVRNYVHELGIWEKQSSFYFQAQSCQNYIAYNIFYNGPRAGINFNDGFGGGSQIYKNLLFNTCRESSDHGPFNSWDRQVYVTDVRFGTPSTMKADDEISYNFVIANYHSQEAIDNDDGSCYYNTHHNFFVYSGNGLKSDFGGHDNKHHYNIYAYVGQGFSINAQLVGHNDAFYNNTLVLSSNVENYGVFVCTSDETEWPILGYNVISTPSGNASLTGLCNMPLEQFQSKYSYDLHSVIVPLPSDEQLLSQAAELLF